MDNVGEFVKLLVFDNENVENFSLSGPCIISPNITVFVLVGVIVDVFVGVGVRDIVGVVVCEFVFEDVGVADGVVVCVIVADTDIVVVGDIVVAGDVVCFCDIDGVLVEVNEEVYDEVGEIVSDMDDDIVNEDVEVIVIVLKGVIELLLLVDDDGDVVTVGVIEEEGDNVEVKDTELLCDKLGVILIVLLVLCDWVLVGVSDIVELDVEVIVVELLDDGEDVTELLVVGDDDFVVVGDDDGEFDGVGVFVLVEELVGETEEVVEPDIVGEVEVDEDGVASDEIVVVVLCVG